jgi:hypothetical protein
MAEFSAPFDGSSIATELQWSRMARRWGLDGVHTEDPASTKLKVTGSGTTTVAVAPGMAFVNGFFYHLDAAKNLTVPANAGGAARVDLVVLRADQAAKKVTAEYKTGGAHRPRPHPDEDGVWEIPLAQCTVAAGSSVVTAANVVDRRYLTGRGVLPSIPGARPPSIKNQLMSRTATCTSATARTGGGSPPPASKTSPTRRCGPPGHHHPSTGAPAASTSAATRSSASASM